jgi:hypothetical protein
MWSGRGSGYLQALFRIRELPGSPEFNVLIFSFLLNLAWEFWQVPFFRGMADVPHWQGVKACTQATLGDAGIALAAFWVTAGFAKTRNWIARPRAIQIAIFIGVGVGLTIIFEVLSTRLLDRWAYADTMPTFPPFGVGLLPVLQWLIIPPLVVYFAGRQMARESR